jgi:hypothetical protein
MIPTLILLGVVFGHWWRWTLVGAAVGWPALLVAADVIGLGWQLLGAAALAVVNTAVGVLVYQGARYVVRRASYRANA